MTDNVMECQNIDDVIEKYWNAVTDEIKSIKVSGIIVLLLRHFGRISMYFYVVSFCFSSLYMLAIRPVSHFLLIRKQILMRSAGTWFLILFLQLFIRYVKSVMT